MCASTSGARAPRAGRRGRDEGGGAAATHHAPAGLARIDFGGTSVLTTRSWYDRKGPRALKLDPGAAAIVGRAWLAGIVIAAASIVAVIWMPALLILLVLLAQPRWWKAAGGRLTTRLDRFEPV